MAQQVLIPNQFRQCLIWHVKPSLGCKKTSVFFKELDAPTSTSTASRYSFLLNMRFCTSFSDNPKFHMKLVISACIYHYIPFTNIVYSHVDSQSLEAGKPAPALAKVIPGHSGLVPIQAPRQMDFDAIGKWHLYNGTLRGDHQSVSLKNVHGVHGMSIFPRCLALSSGKMMIHHVSESYTDSYGYG